MTCLADLTQGLVFVGGTALRASDGATLWAADPATPLWAGIPLQDGDAGVLLTRQQEDNSFAVEVRRSDTGVLVATSDAVRLPLDTHELGPAHLDGNALVLSWWASVNDSTRERGDQPRDGDIEHGLVWIELGGLRTHVERLHDTYEYEPDPRPVDLPPGVVASDLFGEASGGSGSWEAGGTSVAVVVDGTSLVLRTSDGRRAVLESTLPRVGYLELHRTDPLHFVLLRVNENEQDGRPAGAISRWSIYNVADGSLFAELPIEDAPTLPFVVSGIVLTVRQQPGGPTLVALEPANRVERWQHRFPSWTGIDQGRRRGRGMDF